MPNLDPHPYAGLTPDVVLDAIESAGFRCDGRQLALNSYENRVYQVGLEEGAPLVAKFYRPGRWSDAQILEEHAFVTEGRIQSLESWRLRSTAGQRCSNWPARAANRPQTAPTRFGAAGDAGRR